MAKRKTPRAGRNTQPSPSAQGAAGQADTRLADFFAEALRHHQAGQLSQAEPLYRRVLALDRAHVDCLRNLGVLAYQSGRHDEAADLFGQAIALNGQSAPLHYSRGLALQGQGRLDEARAAYQSAIALKPDYAEARYNLGLVLASQGRLDEAAGAYQSAIACRPDYAEAHNNLGAVRQQKGELGEAAAAFRRAVACKPDYAEAHNNLGGVLKAQGKFDEAAAAIRRAVSLKPDLAEAHNNLVGLTPVAGAGPEADAGFELLSRQAEALDQFEPDKRSQMLFALAAALEARGEFDRAFDCLAKANAIHRASLSFDIAEVEQRMAQVAKSFDRGLLERLTGAGEASERPVFIVGMPRSGTTLVEQIISAHPAVHGAGEIPNLANLIEKIRGQGGSEYPFWAGAMTAGDCRLVGQAYLQSLPRAAPGERRITDKWLRNVEHLGLIHLCLPNARIIHCRRDPRDVGLSCFALRFSHGLEFAYDLAELGRYWRAYDQLMAHWRAVLPPGRVLEAPYEAVVEDTDGWARRLIAHCGLEWDEACLRFYESEREVRTASLVQVRRPIYTSSIGRWRAFERHLGPLLEALGEPWAGGAASAG